MPIFRAYTHAMLYSHAHATANMAIFEDIEADGHDETSRAF